MNVRIPFCFGCALTMLGMVSYFGTGATGLVALVAWGFGVVLQLLAVAAEQPRWRVPVLYAVLLLALVSLSASVDAVPDVARALLYRAAEVPAATGVHATLAVASAALALATTKAVLDERRAQRKQQTPQTSRRSR